MALQDAELWEIPVRRPIRTHGQTSPMVSILDPRPAGAKSPDGAAMWPADFSVVAARLSVNNAAGIC